MIKKCPLCGELFYQAQEQVVKHHGEIHSRCNKCDHKAPTSGRHRIRRLHPDSNLYLTETCQILTEDKGKTVWVYLPPLFKNDYFREYIKQSRD